MKVNVGSKNITKVDAVKEAFGLFTEFSSAIVNGIEVDSGVHKQPKSMEETAKGAMTRSKNAFVDCDISVGLESGLIEVPYTKSGYMDITMCSIYDGKTFHLGASSSFEYPKKMVDLVLNQDIDISEAAKEMGFAHDDKIGYREGMVGLLTRGHLDRKSYSKQAVVTALIHLLNPEHY